MSREWTPGDVALFESRHVNSVALRVKACTDIQHGADHESPHWHLASGGYTFYDDRNRPLVVIDPEDAETAERLAVAWGMVETAEFDNTRLTVAGLRMREALRSLLTPPKPDEPTGLGAVVEDDKGERYTRYDSDDPQPWWHNYNGSDAQLVARRYAYSDFHAVRILSEGVPNV